MKWEMAVREIIGPDSVAINWWQMAIRGIFIFMYALLLVRAGNTRMFGKSSAFDIVLGIMLGSHLSRAIAGTASFFPTLVTSGLLVLFHRLLAALSVYSWIGLWVKGREQQLMKDGRLLEEKMKKQQITENDIREAARQKGSTQDLEKVEAAFLERDGSISIIPKK